ncbi:MAG: hypothetical protein KGM17_13800 [Sphingomonadales bacterium]|nr:hypothetical protein [Sphingomonadales bacterium]
MQKKFMTAGLAMVLALPTLVPDAAMARPRHHYSQRVVYHRNCSGGNGAVGTIGGGVGGALIGNALGGTVGTVAGGVGGALLGRHLDKQHTRARNGCRR